MSSRILAGRYELLEKIGDGGMAVVYKARCRLLNRYVAVKILKPEFTRDVKFIENFRKESQAAASLTHSNIVNVYDVGREGGIHYIVMELIDGKVLSDIISEGGPLPVDEAVRITKQIASALGFAHKNHIIHRDVKPHNILITEDGVAKITDFGIAKAMNAETVDDHTGSIMGSVHYFSPEQARGGYVDEKSDLYSLGIVMYEMLTGEVPFDGDNPVAVAMKHIGEPLEPPSKRVAGIPPDIEAIIMKATDKYQVNRYKSADEMLEALNFASLSPIGVYADYHAPSSTKGLDATQMMQMVNQTSLDAGEEKGAGAGKQASAGALANGKGKKAPAGVAINGKGKKAKSPYRLIKIAAVVLALFLAIPLSYFAWQIISGSGRANDVTVPDLAGKTVSEGTKALEDLKLSLAIGDTVEGSEYPEGQIVSQDPPEKSQVKAGSTVTVNISGGQAKGTMPAVVTLSLEDAKSLLKTWNFKEIKVVEEFSDTAKGIVIRQDPRAEAVATEDTVVTLVVSKGKEIVSVNMPKLIGQSISKAKASLEKSQLLLDPKIEYQSSDSVAENLVMDQSIPPGTAIDSGTTVKITVSTGAGDSGGNPDITIPISYDKAQNEVFYLTVMVTDASGPSTPINNAQRLKSNGSEKFVVSGTGKGSVQIYFDNVLVAEHQVNFSSGTVN